MKRLITLVLISSCGIVIEPDYAPPPRITPGQTYTIQADRQKELLRAFYSAGFTDGFRAARSGWNPYNAEKNGFEQTWRKYYGE